MDALPTLILLVEDEHTLASTLAQLLRQQFHGCTVMQAHTLHEAEAALDAITPDIILLDLRLPDSSESRTLGKLLEHPHSGRVPIIVLSGYYSRLEGLAAVAQGAEDYVLKGDGFHEGLLDAVAKACVRQRNVGRAALCARRLMR